MWENETEKQQTADRQPRPEYLKPPPAPVSDGPDYLLRAQIAICVVVALLVFLMRQLGMPAFETVRQDYNEAMESGQPPAAQAAVEFAGDLLAGLQAWTQTALEQWKQQLEAEKAAAAFTGAGGLFPVKQDSVPEGYSLKDCPVEGELEQPLAWYTVTSEYGWRKHPLTGKKDFHTGIDLANAEGTPITPVRQGIVLKTATNSSYGNYVQVMHSDGLVSVYCHMQYVFMRAGECVEPGECLGTVGSTGVSTGPHLHLELISNGIHYDPAAALGVE